MSTLATLQKSEPQNKTDSQSLRSEGKDAEKNRQDEKKRLPLSGTSFTIPASQTSPEAGRNLKTDFTGIALFSSSEFPVQKKSIDSKPASQYEGKTPAYSHSSAANDVNPGTSVQSAPFLNEVQRSFGHHDISRVNVRTNSRAATEALAMGAGAYTQGQEISFSRKPDLHTMAHEAAHVVQQQSGVNVTGGVGREGDIYERHADEVADRVVRGQSSEDLLDRHPDGGKLQPGSEAERHAGSNVIQMRRIPSNVRALLTATGGSGHGANYWADEEGALRLIDHAMEELTPAERARVRTRRLGALTDAQFNALPRLERRSRFAEAILAEFPSLTLGDPALLDVHPRNAADIANIAVLAGRANTILTNIAGGAQDPSLTQVFGAGSIAAAKTKYAAAKAQMNTLVASHDVVTDRGSGFSGEVEEGGLTGPSQISVAPNVIDNPTNNDSITTFIHESMHAGNADVGDNVYLGTSGFTTQSEPNKLLNAAHFEVVPWRMLDPANAFIPAGTSVAGVGAAPARTPAEEGAVRALSQVREAWALGLNLHRQYVHLFTTPTDWTVPQFGGSVHYDRSIPFWSKVQKLTIHEKTIIDPASPDQAKHPVSQIDIALSEGVTRRLALAMDILNPLSTQAQILTFESAHATPGELSTAFPGGAHTNITTEQDFLVKLAIRDPTVAPITGTVVRDLRVVRKLTDPAMTSLWSSILQDRNPNTFPD
jgi:hypothetical protein